MCAIYASNIDLRNTGEAEGRFAALPTVCRFVEGDVRAQRHASHVSRVRVCVCEVCGVCVCVCG